MEKQRLFRADGIVSRADGTPVVPLTPDDKAAMRIATLISKKRSDTNV